ncbi:hypothetical protein MPTK1_2g09640 [Marchantia polymorpha subsp. ruderalis]|uniref:Protein CHAPERONE-LIKE PROTEIN OF POR1, chloroplastic n=2 Tax=Marchantia polymorpha TaxID=3197 RepID=A0A176WM43_MARPO|nr:hypothetical protein AXG93_601s1090 [Marchantia polymorpha subsp. ruderalis]PTQ28658.1 hypothetical protein MARPO_0158s0035 [Marchantia polymorpha]BBN01705.1 hypothetical protein Mp_2g09640 [Marchantia polymorpha subsp. ruderalis]|eukprot:PTQ28658.1 hypothetical protein MARPO_0158s0035 [Marchantia polymorpha]
MATLGSDMLVSCSVGNLQVVSSGGTLPYRNMCSAVSSCSSLSMVYTVAAKGLGSGLVRNISGLTGRARASGRFRYGNLQDAKWGSLRNRNHRFLPISAKGTDDSLSPSEMTLETALKLLGVGEGASFDEILGAKKSLVDSCGGDMDRISQLEAAYDTLLMQSLSQRRRGKVLDNSIRFADVRKAKAAAGGGGPIWLKEALKNSPVAVQTPPVNDIGLQTGVYSALILLTFATGLQPSTQMAIQSGADTPGFILAIGFGASLYFLRKQNVKLGKATLITIAGLVAGAVFGGGVESWLRVDIVPLLGVGSPAVVVSEFVLVSLYLTSLYLR